MSDEAPKQYVCELCGEEFDDTTVLEEHKERHFRPEFGRADVQSEIQRAIGADRLPTSPTRGS